MSKIQIVKDIIKLKSQLSATDYKVLKYMEGRLTEEEYEEVKTQRQAMRDEINALKDQLNPEQDSKEEEVNDQE